MDTASPPSSYTDISADVPVSRCSLASCASASHQQACSPSSSKTSLTCLDPPPCKTYDSPSDYDHSKHDSVSGLNDSVAMNLGIKIYEIPDHESGSNGVPTSYPKQKEALTVTTKETAAVYDAMGLTPYDRIGAMAINKESMLKTYSMSEFDKYPQAKGSDTSCEEMSFGEYSDQPDLPKTRKGKRNHPPQRLGNVTVIKDSLENVFVNVHMAMPDMRDHDGGSGHIPSFPRSKESMTWTDDKHMLSQSDRPMCRKSQHSTQDVQETGNLRLEDAYPETFQYSKLTANSDALQGSSVDGAVYDNDDVDDNSMSECGDDVKIKFVAGKEKGRNSVTITNHKDLKKIVAEADWRKSRSFRNNARGVMSQRVTD